MEAGKRNKGAAKKNRAQAWQRQHQGTARGVVKPNLEKLRHKNPGGYKLPKPPNIH
jgi:hypothetical protein